jgi:IclR family acetate operon transcriptional repressor
MEQRTMRGGHGNRTYGVPMVMKTLRVLEAFRLKGARLSLAEAVELCGIPKASAFRVLETLRSSGYLSKMEHGRYRLTYKFLEAAMVVHELNPVRRVALPYLEQLQQRTAESVNLGILQEDHVVYVEVLESMRSLRMVPTIGSVATIHATALGKAIAAWLPEEHLTQVIRGQRLRRFTPKTIVTKSGLYAELERVRGQGYAVDMEEETLGCVCVAAPICDSKGVPVYAISISGPASRITPARVPQFGKALKEVCQQVRRACGFAGELPRIPAESGRAF